jgi:ubiquinone/menaquinone biosynthesis C-methylase UbiE
VKAESWVEVGVPWTCPHDRSRLSAITGGGLSCPSCGGEYPVDNELELIDFLPAADADPLSDQQSHCWDDEAEDDEIFAAVSRAKTDAESIFVKLPPRLQGTDVDGKVCLDLGCGYGRTLLYAALNGHPRQSIGVDISRTMLSKARGYAREHGLDPTLVRASIDALPLPSESIDFVYSSGVLIHNPTDRTAGALRETVRVLKPGGEALFETSFNGWLNPEGIQQKVVTTLGSRWLRTAWVRTYRRGEVERLVSQAGPTTSEIGPESYTLLPRRVGKIPLTPVKPAITRFNARASRRLRRKSMFVSSWYVRLGK